MKPFPQYYGDGFFNLLKLTEAGRPNNSSRISMLQSYFFMLQVISLTAVKRKTVMLCPKESR
jgi:hypothetical protein